VSGTQIPQAWVTHIEDFFLANLATDAGSITEEQYDNFFNAMIDDAYVEDPLLTELENDQARQVAYDAYTFQGPALAAMKSQYETPQVPFSVPRLSARLALIEAGLWDTIVAYFQDVSRTPQELAYFEDASVWKRTDPIVVGAGTALGLTEAQLDTLFISAEQIRIAMTE
jgi:hypothetical protein